jgi:hypothetical protein
MTEKMTPAFSGVHSSFLVGQLTDIYTAADGARDVVDHLVASIAKITVAKIKDALGLFGQQQSPAPWTPPAIPNTTRTLAGVGIYQEGGIVPGRIGLPQLAVVHGGEEVIRAVDRTGRGGQVINNMEMHVTINGSSEEALTKFQRAFNEMLRRAGFGGSSVSAGAFIPS